MLVALLQKRLMRFAMVKIDRHFCIKAYLEIMRRIRFFNIRNKVVRNLADREYCYAKMKRRFRKFLKEHKLNETNTSKQSAISDYVWICWLQGEEQAPVLVKACIASVRKNMPNKKIVVITNDNISDYVTIPHHIMKKYQNGSMAHAHFSDILRLELLTKYGGYWIDSTVFMSGRQSLFNEKTTELFVFKNINLDRRCGLSTVASNWLIYSAYPNNKILSLTKDLLYEYWKQYNYAINYNIFHILFTLSTQHYSNEWNNVPSMSNIPPHLLQFELCTPYSKERFDYFCAVSCFHKLNHRIYSSDNSSFYQFLINEYHVKE